MRSQALMVAALMLAASPAAFAQTAAPVAPAPANGANHESVRQQITSKLQQSGFTDVQVMPDSFLAQAKDTSGNPVTMFVGPNSVMEVAAINDAGTAGTTGSGGAFTTVPAGDELTSKVVGLDVYNKANQDIGTIKDVAYDGHRVRAYILGVGGFLGMGDHYVAVQPSAVNVSYDNNAKKWRAAMDANADQLKAAPEYKYPARS